MSGAYKYNTVEKIADAEIVEKKSRFIASVSPVETELAAQDFIQEIKKKYHNARHNVFAYRVGIEQEIYRYSDDGEPSGTAGIPILNILNTEDIRNVVVVVTRYFGGILLGTGGLARAYTASAKEGLDAATIIQKGLYAVVKVGIDYATSGKIQYEALNLGHYIYDAIYETDVEFTILVQIDQSDEFIETVTEISNATAKIEVIKKVYGTKIGDKIVI